MRTRRIVAIAAACAVVVVVAVAAAALTRSAQTPAGCADIRQYQDTYGEIEDLGRGDTRVTVLGDSYSAGDALSDRGERWVDVLAETHPELTVTVDAVALTGYANRGLCGADGFRDRIGEAVAASDDILLIQGGLNDTLVDDAGDVRIAIDEVLEAASDVDRVVLIGPIDVPGRDREALIDAELRAAADRHGLAYISALDWDLPIDDDRVHPTTDGHRQYAQRVYDELVAAGVL